MKPHVTLHMGISIDGRIVPHDWPKAATAQFGEVYERIHRELAGDAWIVGRITMAEFGDGAPNPVTGSPPLPRTAWRAPGSDTGRFAIAIDQSGRLHLNRNRANDDAIVVITTESVSDDYLAELRRDGISYIFAGKDSLDFAAALEQLGTDYGISRLLLEGGGGINGSFLSAGLIDEISLMVLPVADGAVGSPTLFDRVAAAGVGLALTGVTQLESDIVHLRYTIR